MVPSQAKIWIPLGIPMKMLEMLKKFNTSGDMPTANM
jgi:hypothetical protein